MKKLLLGILSLYSITLYAQNCIDWGYSRNIVIDNTSGTDLNDYQVKLEINSQQLVDEGKLQADGSDLRVLDGDCMPLYFWGDSLGTSTSTDIWIKIPFIAAGESQNIQLYYGNETAESVVDGKNTFMLFDDFNAEEVDLEMWESIGAYGVFEIVDGKLNYASTGANPGPRFKFVRTVQSFSDPAIFDFTAYQGSSSGWGLSSSDVTLDRILFRPAGFGPDTLNQVAFMFDTLSNGYQVEGMYPLLRFQSGIFNEVSMTAMINELNHLELNRFANETIQDENINIFELSAAEMTGFHFMLSTFLTQQLIEMDNFRVRQFTEFPPVTTLGEEELVEYTSVLNLESETYQFNVFPNPTSDYCQIQANFQEPVFIELIDVQGRTVISEKVMLSAFQNHQLNLNTLAEGSYVLKLIRAADRYTLATEKLLVLR